MTRAAIFSFIVAVASLSGTTSGFTYYEGPWCMTATITRSTVSICNFRTFEQCLHERYLWGGSAFCGQNPRYLPYWTGRNGRAARKSPR